MNPKYKQDLCRILNDRRMRRFHAQFDDLITGAHAGGVLAGALDRWLADSRRRVLLLLVAKGGKFVKATRRARISERVEKARSLREAAALLRADADIARCDVEGVIYWANRDRIRQPVSKLRRRYLGDGDAYVDGPPMLSEDARRPGYDTSLVGIIEAAAARMERGERMSSFDSIHQARAVSQQAQLERSLWDNFAFFAISPNTLAEVMAPAIAAALDLPKSVDVGRLTDRFRKNFAANAKNNSETSGDS